MDSDSTLPELYEWICEIENELLAVKRAFPDVLRPASSTMVAAVSCLRVSLELRVTQPGARRGGTPPTGTALPSADESLSRPY